MEASGGRRPTSHERRSGEPWDVSYRDRSAPWDIGRPQDAFARLIAVGTFAGAVLDAGCGTGEHALAIAAQGLPVLGVDIAETALSIAREKARTRHLDAEFLTCDALHLDRLGRTFDSVLDCGLFHTFDSEERPDYVASLAAATRPGAQLHLLCFSDAEDNRAPHPVTEDELRAAFTPNTGWSIESIAPDRIEITFDDRGFPAWLVAVERV